MEEEKLYLAAKTTCRKCKSPMLLVLSRSGGFISKNCISCNNPRTVGLNELPDLTCGQCKGVIKPTIKLKNYFYECKVCKLEWELAKLVPHWKEHFEFSSLPVPSDFGILQPPEVLDVTVRTNYRPKSNSE